MSTTVTGMSEIRIFDGETVVTETSVLIIPAPNTIIVGDPVADPCGVIVLQGELTITTTNTTTTQFFTDVKCFTVDVILV